MANESSIPGEPREASSSEAAASNPDEAATAHADTSAPTRVGRLWNAALGGWIFGKPETDVWLAVFLILLVMLAHVIRMVIAATPEDLQIATLAVPLFLAAFFLELLVFGAVGSLLGRSFRVLWRVVRPRLSAKSVMGAILAGGSAIFLTAPELKDAAKFWWEVGSQLAPATAAKIQSTLALEGSKTLKNLPAILNGSAQFLLGLTILFLIAGLFFPTLLSYLKEARNLLRNRRWIIAIPVALGLGGVAAASAWLSWLIYLMPFLEMAAVIWFLWPWIANELPVLLYLAAAFTPVTLFSSSAFSIFGGGFVIATSLATPFYFKTRLFRVGWWVGVLAFIGCLVL